MACNKNTENPSTEGPTATCTQTFTRQVDDLAVDRVSLVGSFNDWDETATPMSEVAEGLWSVTLELEPGPMPYRFLESIDWSHDGVEYSVCDPKSDFIHCDNHAAEPGEWSNDCVSGQTSTCSSLAIIEDCSIPQLEVINLEIDRNAGQAIAEIAFIRSAADAEMASAHITLDGAILDPEWANNRVEIVMSDLDPGRHTLRVSATDQDEQSAEAVWIPFWTDMEGEEGWRSGSLYFAMIDRFANGDDTIDMQEGASEEIVEYMGGDFQGLTDQLPYLADLGVRSIWISNPSDNVSETWDGDCSSEIAAYHGYWPTNPMEVDEHFGGSDALKTLIDAAHTEGLRVVMDWVGNHVHQQHAYVSGEANWFTEKDICSDEANGSLNWDRIPETCWFTEYLPTLDYSDPEVLNIMVEDAVWWAKTYDFDGLRIDAAKHMPHSVSVNLSARFEQEAEYTSVGGDTLFLLIGESFSSREVIANYIDQNQLDGQFDFPQYYALLATFVDGTSSLEDLSESINDGEAAYGDAVMSGFLGNHDVARFVTLASQTDEDSCVDGNDSFDSADVSPDPNAYASMMMAWTFLFTQPSIPLIYYGDEFGMPGLGDPDNRHPFWWYSLADNWSLEGLIDQLDPNQAAVLSHVAILAETRASHPAMWRGSTTEWWMSPSEWPTLWAYARVDDETNDAVLVLINIGDEDQTIENGLGFAGLPVGGNWTQPLTGSTSIANGDSLTVTVKGREAILLVAEQP